MKKIIGSLGVVVIAAVMFFSANNLTESSSDISLAELITFNVENANSEGGSVTCHLVSADLCILTNFGAYQGYRVNR
jgi:hypothetical protein